MSPVLTVFHGKRSYDLTAVLPDERFQTIT